MKYHYTLIFICVHLLCFSQIEVDTTRIIELQKIVSEIRVDSLAYPEYEAKYLPYFQEVMRVLYNLPKDSLKNPEFRQRYEPYNELNVRFSHLFFEAEQRKPPLTFDSTIIELYKNGKKKQIEGAFKVYAIATDTILECETQGISFMIPKELDSLSHYDVILKYNNYLFRVYWARPPHPQKSTLRKVHIDINTMPQPKSPKSQLTHSKKHVRVVTHFVYEYYFYSCNYAKENNQQLYEDLKTDYNKTIIDNFFSLIE